MLLPVGKLNQILVRMNLRLVSGNVNLIVTTALPGKKMLSS